MDNNTFIEHLRFIILVSIYLFSILLVGVLGFHWLTPEAWHFLSWSQVKGLEMIIFGVFISSMWNTWRMWFKNNGD